MKLRSKVAIITGGSSGIGRATAVLFAKEGAKVIVTADKNVKGGNETVRLIKAAGREGQFIKCDVTKEADIQKSVRTVLDKYGKIDILVNNAGWVLISPFEETTTEQFDKVVGIDFKGTFLMSKYVIPHMKKQRSGVIVNMASVAGHVAQVDHAVYCGTKGAVIAMTRGMAVELAPYNIRVNSVSPGSVDTPMLRGDIRQEAIRHKEDPEKLIAQRTKEGIVGRWATPEEIAPIILYLASDDASFMTGADILIDGGWTAK